MGTKTDEQWASQRADNNFAVNWQELLPYSYDFF